MTIAEVAVAAGAVMEFASGSTVEADMAGGKISTVDLDTPECWNDWPEVSYSCLKPQETV